MLYNLNVKSPPADFLLNNLNFTLKELTDSVIEKLLPTNSTLVVPSLSMIITVATESFKKAPPETWRITKTIESDLSIAISSKVLVLIVIESGPFALPRLKVVSLLLLLMKNSLGMYVLSDLNFTNILSLTGVVTALSNLNVTPTFAFASFTFIFGFFTLTFATSLSMIDKVWATSVPIKQLLGLSNLNTTVSVPSEITSSFKVISVESKIATPGLKIIVLGSVKVKSAEAPLVAVPPTK